MADTDGPSAREMPPVRPTVAFAPDAERLVVGLVFGMLWLEAMVVVLDLGLHHSGVLGPDLAGWFDASAEGGFGSWLAVSQAWLLALTAWGVAAVTRKTGASRARLAGWVALAAGLSLIALDDGTMLHERAGSAFADTEAAARGLGDAFPSYYWQIVLGPVFAAFGLFLGVFLWRALGTAQQRLRVALALGLLAVAVGLDFLDRLPTAHAANGLTRFAVAIEGLASPHAFLGIGALDATVHFARVVEESLEMAAMTLLWAALLAHLVATVGGVTLRWAPTDAPLPLPEAPLPLPEASLALPEAPLPLPEAAGLGGDGAVAEAVMAGPAR